MFSLVTIIDERREIFNNLINSDEVHNDNESSLYSISGLYSHEMSFSL